MKLETRYENYLSNLKSYGANKTFGGTPEKPLTLDEFKSKNTELAKKKHEER